MKGLQPFKTLENPILWFKTDRYRSLYIGCKLQMHSDISSFQINCHPIQGQLQIWTEHSTLIFENLKPVEKFKKKSF